MRVRAAIEISSQQDPGTVEQLIASAYRRSTAGCIGLMLNGVDKWTVNRLLDRVVASVGTDVPGVVYCDVTDAGALRGLVGSATQVMTLTEPLCSQLRQQGIVSELVPAGEMLRRIEEPAAQACEPAA